MSRSPASQIPFGNYNTPNALFTSPRLGTSPNMQPAIINTNQLQNATDVVKIANYTTLIQNQPQTTPLNTIQTPQFTQTISNPINNFQKEIDYNTSAAILEPRNTCPWWIWVLFWIVAILFLSGTMYASKHAFLGFVKSAWQGTKQVASSVWEGTKDVASIALQQAKDIGKFAKDTAGNVTSGIIQKAKKVADTTKTVASKVWQKTKDAASNAWQGTKNIGKAAIKASRNAASNAVSGVKKVASAAGDAASAAWQGTKSVGKRVYEGAKMEEDHKNSSREQNQENHLYKKGRITHFRRQ